MGFTFKGVYRAYLRVPIIRLWVLGFRGLGVWEFWGFLGGLWELAVRGVQGCSIFPDPREDQGFRYYKGSKRDTIRA